MGCTVFVLSVAVSAELQLGIYVAGQEINNNIAGYIEAEYIARKELGAPRV
jgi:hypothetical protein